MTAQDYGQEISDLLARWEPEYRPRVLETILACGVRQHDAEDVAHDVLLKECRRLKDGGTPPRSPASWLKKLAVNKAMDYHRNQGSEAGRRERLAKSGRVRTEVDPEAECKSGGTERMIEAMRTVLESLPQPEQRLLEWRFFKGYKLGMIAAELGISQPAVQKRLIKIYKRLHMELKERVREHLPE
jgi:RNA polymerase sigma factor (sigma-70 family)